ncbi:MAG: AMIN domain-containing protein [Desulfobulbus sp.]|nr:MAG: AMIN domain-containing protein [Desulfobulbus sp.]
MLNISCWTRKRRFLHSRHFVAVLLIAVSTSFSALQASAANSINAISVAPSGLTHVIRIQAGSEPAYTVYELFKPSRIVVDIADATVADPQKLQLQGALPYSLATSTVSDTDPALTRLEFTFTKEYAGYEVKTNNNEIVLTVDLGDQGQAKNMAAPAAPAGAAAEPDQINALIAQKQNVESQLPEVPIPADPVASEAANTTEMMQSSFSFGGYGKQRITVDFYKIDLHNVFRLFREVSDVNIVVDEAVKGSLTLALNDVPWDFALDIILNLKDLQKEERFNTIVILPKAKEFYWPERTEDNLSFEADENIAVQEAIVIQQQMNVPPEVAEAKKILQKGRELEKNGSYEDAVEAYTEALAKWPDNDRLANKIASLYLVYLRQNAKAVYFAKQALQTNSKNAGAALNAAIALANMQENKEAQQYFAQSVSGDKPSREALLSYAVFSEEQKLYDGAITLLDKVDNLYGQSVDSMIAYARILDKKGNHAAATEKYKAILLSGFQIPPDLKKYINSRIALNQSM